MIDSGDPDDLKARPDEMLSDVRRQTEEINPVEPLYTQEDIDQWRTGAENYHKFLDSKEYPKIISWLTVPGLDVSEQISELQYMFLGEKPALFKPGKPWTFSPQTPAGYQIVGNYLFRTDMVEKVYSENKELFQKNGLSSGKRAVKALARSRGDELHVIRGLILGYPLEAAQSFERTLVVDRLVNPLYVLLKDKPEFSYFDANWAGGKEEGKDERRAEVLSFWEDLLTKYHEQLGTSSQDIPKLLDEIRYFLSIRAYGVEGFDWTDGGEATASIRKTQRLEAALRESGI